MDCTLKYSIQVDSKSDSHQKGLLWQSSPADSTEQEKPTWTADHACARAPTECTNAACLSLQLSSARDMLSLLPCRKEARKGRDSFRLGKSLQPARLWFLIASKADDFHESLRNNAAVASPAGGVAHREATVWTRPPVALHLGSRTNWCDFGHRPLQSSRIRTWD